MNPKPIAMLAAIVILLSGCLGVDDDAPGPEQDEGPPGSNANAVDAGPVAEYEDTAEFVTGLLADPPEATLQCPGFVLGVSGLGCVFFTFEDDHSGMRFELDASRDAMRYSFWSECDPNAEGIESGTSDGPSLTGTVPDGAGCVVAWAPATSSQEGPIDYTFKVFAN